MFWGKWLTCSYFYAKFNSSSFNSLPDIRISLDVTTAPEIEKKGAVQEFDFGLIIETQQENPFLHYETIGEDALVLAFSPSHKLATK